MWFIWVLEKLSISRNDVRTGISIYKTISELDVPPKQDPTAIIDTKLSVILSIRKNVGIMLSKAASIIGEQFARRHII